MAITLVTDGTVAAGDLMVVAVCTQGASSVSVTDNAGTTYTAFGPYANFVQMFFGYAASASSGFSWSATVTTDGQYTLQSVANYRGAPAGMTVEQGNNYSGTAVTADTGAISTSGKIAFGACLSYYSVSSPSWTQASISSGSFAQVFLDISSSPIELTYSNTYNEQWAAQVGILKTASGGGGSSSAALLWVGD